MTLPRLKADLVVRVHHPFVVVIEPGDVINGQLQWQAKIIGHEFDNYTFADSPTAALEEALDLVRTLTGKCDDDEEHVWAIDTVLEPDEDFDGHPVNTPAWGCLKCNEVVSKEMFE